MKGLILVRTGGRPRKGIALILCLGFTAVIMMLLGVTLISTNGANIFTQDYHGKTAAYYVAESGLSYVQDKLEEDRDWTGSFNDKETPFKSGHFSVSFSKSSPYYSINNLSGTEEANGPNGLKIPPHTAYIRVVGTANGRSETLECLIGKRSEDMFHSAILAADRVVFGDKIQIDTVNTPEVSTNGVANVISNSLSNESWGLENDNQPLAWINSEATSDNFIHGALRSASPSDSSINTHLKDIADNHFTNQATVKAQNVSIKEIVQNKLGVASIFSAAPGVNHLSGDYYSSTDQNVSGDIDLDNANLYIKGDLTVNGTIKGKGSVYVTGTTKFMGDAEIAANDDGVTLYSQGNVILEGFDGSAWLESVTSTNNDYKEVWKSTQNSFQLLAKYLKEFANGDYSHFIAHESGDVDGGKGSDAVRISQILGTSWRSADASYLPAEAVGSITQNNLIKKLQDIIDAQPTSGAQSFLKKKMLTLLDTEHQDYGTNGGILAASTGIGFKPGFLKNWLETGESDRAELDVELILMGAHLKDGNILTGNPGSGPWRAYNDPTINKITADELKTAILKHYQWIDSFGFDHIGSSYFKGSIYTRGAFVCKNDVTIIGSLSAVPDPYDESPPSDLIVEDSKADGTMFNTEVKIGSIYLGRDTRVVFQEGIKPGVLLNENKVSVISWLK